MMKWTFESGIPIYLQILTRLKGDIAGGAYPPGMKLPPVRELALEAGVNPNTMQRAFAELERDGLVYTQRTSGRFVTEDAGVLRQLRRTLSEEIIQEMFARLGHLGMSREEILSAVSEWAGQSSENSDGTGLEAAKTTAGEATGTATEGSLNAAAERAPDPAPEEAMKTTEEKAGTEEAGKEE